VVVVVAFPAATSLSLSPPPPHAPNSSNEAMAVAVTNASIVALPFRNVMERRVTIR
jgi:hypothetical protein